MVHDVVHIPDTLKFSKRTTQIGIVSKPKTKRADKNKTKIKKTHFLISLLLFPEIPPHMIPWVCLYIWDIKK